MATVYTDPNGDSTPMEWFIHTNPDNYYSNIDDGVRQPTVPSTDRVGTSSTVTEDATFDMATISVGTNVPNITVWIYAAAVAPPDAGVCWGSIYTSGQWSSFQDFGIAKIICGYLSLFKVPIRNQI